MTKEAGSEHFAKTIAVELKPLGGEGKLVFVTDERTGAIYCECHILASRLISLATADVPLDPDEQSEYRANRELVENASAFIQMKQDALSGRSFSNIVAEYNTDFDPDHPIKIIGGQHRFAAICEAGVIGVDKWQGIKLYVGLDKAQRLDVQLISNTNIAVSGDLYDRMQETVRGPQLRLWAQRVGFLEEGQDFADKRVRGGPISVQIARSFILNYLAGQSVDVQKFDSVATTPEIVASGKSNPEWESLLATNQAIWDDDGLKKAALQFSRLISAQRTAFSKAKRVPLDQPEKALNLAVMAAWAYIAGLLSGNATRAKRHYALADATGKDPLNAPVLAAAKHKTDPENYRGLGYRTDAKERGRFVELFFLQAEKGEGINKPLIELAMKKYVAKQANLDVSQSI